MKKILLIISIIFLTGCMGKGEEVVCKVNGKEAIFTLKDGIVKNYKLDGKSVKRSEIDEINGLYFTSSTNNDEGVITLKKYVSSIGGSCD